MTKLQHILFFIIYCYLSEESLKLNVQVNTVLRSREKKSVFRLGGIAKFCLLSFTVNVFFLDIILK